MTSYHQPAAAFSLSRVKLVWTAVAVFSIAIFFALYTDHAWEDWYITYRASKNLATGNGLVFTVGERLHTFTSPLGTLIPALFNLATLNSSDHLVLWLFRIFGSGLLALAAVLLLKAAAYSRLGTFAAMIMIGLFATDAKIIDYSINGMETALMMVFLAAVLHVLTAPCRRGTLILGLAWGGLMWTRPDSFVYFGAIAAAYLLFKPESPHFSTRKEMLLFFIKAGVVAAVLYLPWFLWAWYYYGNPVPHTIVAKGLSAGHSHMLLNFLTFPWATFTQETSVMLTFLPAYFNHGGWPGWMGMAGRVLGLVCAYYWCLPVGDRRGRALSLALFLAHFYLSRVAAYVAPWYLPNVGLLAIAVCGHMTGHLPEKLRAFLPAAGTAVRAAAVALVMVLSLLTVLIAWQLRFQQATIENGNRKLVGLWLRQNAASGDRVFLEPLGYIGFFSGLKMLDFPGLASKEMVVTRMKLRTNRWDELIPALRPEWLVLRPSEALQGNMQAILSSLYRPVKLFDVSDKVKAQSFLPGRGYIAGDQTFVVYRRIAASGTGY